MFTVDIGKFQNWHLPRQDFQELVIDIDPGFVHDLSSGCFNKQNTATLSEVTAVIENQIICILANGERPTWLTLVGL